MSRSRISLARPVMALAFGLALLAPGLGSAAKSEGPLAATWAGTGHFVAESIGYTDGTHARPYTAAPNFRQGGGSLNLARSDILAGEPADIYINFGFDTSGKTVYVVYTTNGSQPNKSNGTVVTASFSKYWEPNRTWFATIPSMTSGTNVNYVIYISDSTLAFAWGRISGTPANRLVSQYQTSWNENDGAGFWYYAIGPSVSINTPAVRSFSASPDGTYPAQSTDGVLSITPYYTLQSGGLFRGEGPTLQDTGSYENIKFVFPLIGPEPSLLGNGPSIVILERNFILNADGGPGQNGATISPPNSSLPGGNSQWNPGETLTPQFRIGLMNPNRPRFTLSVNILGTPVSPAYHAQSAAAEPQLLGTVTLLCESGADGPATCTTKLVDDTAYDLIDSGDIPR